MFLIHCKSATGRLTIRKGANRLEVYAQNGSVVGLAGIPNLLESVGVKGTPSMNLESLLGRAFQDGVPLDKAMQAAADGLGRTLAETIAQSGGSVSFEENVKPDGAPMRLSVSIPKMILSGVRAARQPDFIRKQLAPISNRPVTLRIPLTISTDRLGLPPVALRLVRRAKKRQTLDSLLKIDNSGGRSDEWSAVDLLMQLGLLSIESRRVPVVVAAPPQKSANHTTELRAAHSLLKNQQPWQILELKTAKQLTDDGIERACHVILARYHPDRFTGAQAQAQALAQRCFSLVIEARDALSNASLRTEVKARLEAESRGEKYITEQERKAGDMAYARGLVSFRRRNFSRALSAFQKAHEFNPALWRHNYMLIRSQYETGDLPGTQAASQLLQLQGPQGLSMADVFFDAGEIYMKIGQDDRAYEAFERVLQTYPGHIGARRHIRLRKRRSQVTDVEPAPGLLSGLFGRLKR
jgi:tetratricopeptide (TPR) repeat protein